MQKKKYFSIISKTLFSFCIQTEGYELNRTPIRRNVKLPLVDRVFWRVCEGFYTCTFEQSFFIFYCNNNITLHTKINFSTYSANIAYDLTILTQLNTNIIYNLFIAYIRAVATIGGFLTYLFVIFVSQF